MAETLEGKMAREYALERKQVAVVALFDAWLREHAPDELRYAVCRARVAVGMGCRWNGVNSIAAQNMIDCAPVYMGVSTVCDSV